MRTFLCGIFSILVAIQWTESSPSPDPLDTINIKFNMEEEPVLKPKPTRWPHLEPKRGSRDYGAMQQDPDLKPKPTRWPHLEPKRGSRDYGARQQDPDLKPKSTRRPHLEPKRGSMDYGAMQQDPDLKPKPTRRPHLEPKRGSMDYGAMQQDPDLKPKPTRRPHLDPKSYHGAMPWAQWAPEGDKDAMPQHPEGESERGNDYVDVPEYGSYLVSSDGPPVGASPDKYNSKLGTYTSTGHTINKFNVFKKENDYLFVNPSSGFWTIGTSPFSDIGYFRHSSPATDTPPTTGWQYRREDSSLWQDNAGITVKGVTVHSDYQAFQPPPGLPCPSLQTDLIGKQHSRTIGHDVLDWQTCGFICNDDDNCVYWTWENGNRCIFMQAYTGTQFRVNTVSGDRNCTNVP